VWYEAFGSSPKEERRRRGRGRRRRKEGDREKGGIELWRSSLVLSISMLLRRELEGWCLEAATNLQRMMMGKSVIFVSCVLLVEENLSDFLLHGLGMKSETLKWCMEGISVSFFFFPWLDFVNLRLILFGNNTA
jgi:hypothetical protein